MWNLDSPFPRPTGDWMRCPVCGSRNYLIQSWHGFDRYDHPPEGVTHRVPFRCDVTVKCMNCANVWVHGLALPQSWADTYPEVIGRKIYWNQPEALSS